MEILYLNDQLNIQNSICSAIGFFDGLHLGHQQLIDEVIKIHQKTGYKKALITFDHHPLFVLGRIDEEYYLTSMQDRIELLEKYDIDYLFIIRFTKDVAKLSPQEFIDKFIIKNNIKHIVCGFDYKFGDKNSGNIQTLIEYNPNQLSVSVIDEVLYFNEKISSSRTRQAIIDGDMLLAKQLLGRYYCIKGNVIKGRQIGKILGFPTANVDYNQYLLPKRGVYASIVKVDDTLYLGMTNIGYNPTVGSLEKKSLEVHIIDFDGDIYNQNINVMFIDNIRGEMKFNCKEELIYQLSTDKKYIINHYSLSMI